MRRPPLRLLRLANPVVRRILDSRAHGPLSTSLMILEYRGRRSGRTFRIPVMYARAGGEVVALAVAPERKQWWRTFRERAPARLTIGGTTTEVEGRVLRGDAARDALRSYLRRFPRAAGTIGARADDPPNDLAAAAARVSIVSFGAPPGAER
jgi:deazaflavin-dependent oxidoreductase (nitroreductase family)